ncbi:hypothetical protein IJ732_08550, partial [bacterium]|nr:hypothetical protein [bacterium]
MNNFLTRLGGGALGLKGSENADLGLENFNSPSLRANEESEAIPNALNTRQSELVSESVKAVSQKQTLMSN